MPTKIQSRTSVSAKRVPHVKKAISPMRESTAKSSMRDLFLSIAASGHKIPEEERARFPKDLAKNHEHYLYGHPKQYNWLLARPIRTSRLVLPFGTFSYYISANSNSEKSENKKYFRIPIAFGFWICYIWWWVDGHLLAIMNDEVWIMKMGAADGSLIHEGRSLKIFPEESDFFSIGSQL
jgi:hypothetical protein